MLDAAMVTRHQFGVDGADGMDVVGRLQQYAGVLPQISLEYEPAHKLLWITMRPEPKPVLTLPMIDSLRRVQLAIHDIWGATTDRPILFAALRSRGRVFSLGGDLDFILDCLAKNDRPALEDYARIACEAIALSREGMSGTVLTFAAVKGRVMGGGIDTARGCNTMVAEEGATFCYPEVNYNHFPIAAVPVLSRHARLAEVTEILMSGRDFGAADFAEMGIADALVPTGTSEDWIRRYADGALASHAARIGIVAACNRQHGDVAGQLAAGVLPWVRHIMTLKPIEISKLQRIATAQERLLGRLLRDASPVPASPDRVP